MVARWPAPNSCRASVSPIYVQIAIQVQEILPKRLRHFPPFLHQMLYYLKLGHDHFFHSLPLFIFHSSSRHFNYWSYRVVSKWASVLQDVSLPLQITKLPSLCCPTVSFSPSYCIGMRLVMTSRSFTAFLPFALFLLLHSSYLYHCYRICVVALVSLLSPKFSRLLYLCLLLEQFKILQFALSPLLRHVQIRPHLLVLKHECHRNRSSDHQVAVSYLDLHNQPNREDHPNILQTLNLNLATDA